MFHQDPLRLLLVGNWSCRWQTRRQVRWRECFPRGLLDGGVLGLDPSLHCLDAGHDPAPKANRLEARAVATVADPAVDGVLRDLPAEAARLQVGRQLHDGQQSLGVDVDHPFRRLSELVLPDATGGCATATEPAAQRRMES